VYTTFVFHGYTGVSIVMTKILPHCLSKLFAPNISVFYNTDLNIKVILYSYLILKKMNERIYNRQLIYQQIYIMNV